MAHEKGTMVAVETESIDVVLNTPPNFSRDVGWQGGALYLLALTRRVKCRSAARPRSIDGTLFPVRIHVKGARRRSARNEQYT